MKNNHILEYSYDERKQFVIGVVKTGMLSDNEFGDEYNEAMGTAIEKILSEVFDKWKRD